MQASPGQLVIVGAFNSSHNGLLPSQPPMARHGSNPLLPCRINHSLGAKLMCSAKICSAKASEDFMLTQFGAADGEQVKMKVFLMTRSQAADVRKCESHDMCNCQLYERGPGKCPTCIFCAENIFTNATWQRSA